MREIVKLVAVLFIATIVVIQPVSAMERIDFNGIFSDFPVLTKKKPIQKIKFSAEDFSETVSGTFIFVIKTNSKDIVVKPKRFVLKVRNGKTVKAKTLRFKAKKFNKELDTSIGLMDFAFISTDKDFVGESILPIEYPITVGKSKKRLRQIKLYDGHSIETVMKQSQVNF